MRALLLALALVACAAPPAEKDEAPSAPVLPIANTSWALVDADAPRLRQPPTISFSSEGRANGFAGCNQWFAQFDQSAGGLRFQSIGMTRRACPPPEMDVERRFVNMLEQTRAARIESDTLTLSGEAEDLARLERMR